ncbi:hypothetical protein K493DRAFT_336860 [Basidiobolus meristosporus CBS 931.73]|uniref:Mid2 domain-containing protein n=1 Tax=Basidiobolus meristosporus CBS 931.73 TaxID=1314790 RepID=A0A1Y1YEZ3_9FUNG|nr:hypothetical protein K493DRAFT_336860 [Basidiobolus meristosporus CBS 931.73]|eukprot:ORX96572.1 hypothetical protein K493DRAFT_336860 [Basidiobolus meristosporus CBS 931.73]
MRFRPLLLLFCGLCCALSFTASQSTRTSIHYVTATNAGTTATLYVATETYYEGSTQGSSASNESPSSHIAGKSKSNTTAIIAGVSVGAVVLLSVIGWAVYRHWKAKSRRRTYANKPMSDNLFRPTPHRTNNDPGFLRELNEF